MRVSWLRRGVQLLSLLLFVWLMIKTTWPLQVPMPPQLFLRADPLAALAVALSPGRSWALLALFWPALALLAATALLGRFFCGWLCPLGACVEGADAALLWTRQRKRRPVQDVPAHAIKYVLLVLVLITAAFGVHLFYVLDPIPLLARTYAVFADGTARGVYNDAVPLLRHWGMHARPVDERPFRLAAETAGMFVLILLGGLIGPRVWCRSLCPLGALLGLVGSHGLWRRKTGEACNSCRRCVGSCPMRAIPAAGPTETRQPECIQCYECVPACPRGANALVVAPAPVDSAVDADRRHFLAVSAAGLGYGTLTTLGVIPRFVTSRLIRPPGAIVRGRDGAYLRLMTDEEFRAKCLRCGQCMKACVTGGLQPAIAEAGLDGFYTPVLKPRTGWCEQTCLACGEVCPSGALIPFSAEEKTRIQIGRAHIDRETCLGWGKGDKYRECLVCDEHCSYKAIELRDEQGAKRPYVDHRKCVGCGICENACPVRPEAAIVVHRVGRQG